MKTKDPVNYAVFFISTGRCSTQFFADTLTEYYKELAVVRHEPFNSQYNPPRYFSAFHRKANIRLSSILEDHVAFINDTLENKHYIETGWPVYGALPFILSRLQGRVKVVHLYRHPLRVAASLTTHNVYARGEWSKKMSISPSDYGVVQGHLSGKKWNSMATFEKCLFWWTEINQYALDLQKYYKFTPWFSIRWEDLFIDNRESELGRLLEFLDFPSKEVFLNSLGSKTDKFSIKTTENIDPECLNNYPAALQVMGHFGYTYDHRMAKELHARYKIPLHNKWQNKAKRAIQFFR